LCCGRDLVYFLGRRGAELFRRRPFPVQRGVSRERVDEKLPVRLLLAAVDEDLLCVRSGGHVAQQVAPQPDAFRFGSCAIEDVSRVLLERLRVS
jgi:hypothetical protein